MWSEQGSHIDACTIGVRASPIVSFTADGMAIIPAKEIGI